MFAAQLFAPHTPTYSDLCGVGRGVWFGSVTCLACLLMEPLLSVVGEDVVAALASPEVRLGPNHMGDSSVLEVVSVQQGEMGLVAKVRARDGGVCVLKLKTCPAPSSDAARSLVAVQDSPARVTCVTGVDLHEADMARVLGCVLVNQGVTVHYPRPLGLVEVMLEEGVFGAHVRSLTPRVQALAMEALEGVPCRDGTTAVDMQTFLEKGMAGLIDNFGLMFRVALFQVLYTIQTSLIASGGWFRHNDLHVRNVCMGQFFGTRRSRTIPYEVCEAGGTSCKSFTITRWRFDVPAVVRAVIIDFGWAAFLPGQGVGPLFDSRFFSTRDGRTFEMKECAGMSSTTLSRHYDMFMFMASVYSTIEKATTVGVELDPIIMEFKALYRKSFGHMNLSRDVVVAVGNGRLTLKAQAELYQSGRMTFTYHGEDGRVLTETVSPPTTDSLLCNPFFKVRVWVVWYGAFLFV